MDPNNRSSQLCLLMGQWGPDTYNKIKPEGQTKHSLFFLALLYVLQLLRSQLTSVGGLDLACEPPFENACHRIGWWVPLLFVSWIKISMSFVNLLLIHVPEVVCCDVKLSFVYLIYHLAVDCHRLVLDDLHDLLTAWWYSAILCAFLSRPLQTQNMELQIWFVIKHLMTMFHTDSKKYCWKKLLSDYKNQTISLKKQAFVNRKPQSHLLNLLGLINFSLLHCINIQCNGFISNSNHGQ